LVLKSQKVAVADVGPTHRNLCGRDPEPHPARPGDDIWDDDLVAAGMVASRVGHGFHCGLHAERHFACAADAGLGLLAAGKNAATSSGSGSGVYAHTVDHWPTCGNGWRGNF